MNIKRFIFMGGLLVLFVCCYSTMNKHYDELARYQYVNDDNRKIITEHLDVDEINVLIDRQYKPEEFIPYLGLDGFNIRYVDWYNDALKVKEMEPKALFALVNQSVASQLDYATFMNYYSHYDLDVFQSYLNKESMYLKDLKLVLNPTQLQLTLHSSDTLYRYMPNDLVAISELPVVSESETQEQVVVTQQTHEALAKMCQAIAKDTQAICGNLIATKGFVSYEEQVKMYEEEMLKVGKEQALQFVDYPGQSYYQLGTVVKMVPIQAALVFDHQTQKVSIQQQWLMDHAHEYGFDFINKSDGSIEEFVLRYIGQPVVTPRQGGE